MGAVARGEARVGGIRVFGIPVSVDLSFLIVALLLSSQGTGNDPMLLVLGIAVIAVSILIHELGHALVFRRLGAAPNIRLTGFGGLTSPNSTGHGWPRGGQLAATVAGPAAGFALAALAWALLRMLPQVNLMTWIALQTFVTLNLFWSALNLLPIFPLDGGHILRELLRLAGRRNPERTSIVVSIVVGLLAAGLALWAQQYWNLLIVAYLVFINVGSLQQTKQAHQGTTFNATVAPYLDGGAFPSDALRETLRDRSAPEGHRTAAAALSLHWSLVTGQSEDKAALYDALSPSPALRALVPEDSGTPMSPPAAARALYDAEPGGLTGALVIRELAADHQPDALRDFACEHLDHIGVAGSLRVQSHLFRAGLYDDAAAVAQRTWDVHADPMTAYNLACCAERRGDIDAGLVWLVTAINGGFRDAELVDADEDLRGVRRHPDYPPVRARLTV